VTGEEVICITARGADAAVVVFTQVGDSLSDVIRGIESGLVDAGGAVVGVISDVGNGISGGAVYIWDSIF
jgi:glutamate synthase domain-containing protein 3